MLAQDIKGDPIRKAEVLGDIVRTIALVPDLMERTEYVTQCASLLHVPEETLQSELAKTLNRKLYESLNHKSDPNDKDLAESGKAGTENGEGRTESGERRVETVVPFTLNPAQTQERKIISLLLNDGGEWLDYENKDDEGKPIIEKYTVAQVVVGELLEDNVTFEDPVCQLIFNEYARRINDGESVVNPQIFVTSSDERVRETAVTMMMTDYHVSDKWKDKLIHVPLPQERLRMDVVESLMTLKLKKLDAKIDDIDRQFAYLTDNDEKLMLMAEKMRLIQLRQKIGAALNRVIS